MDPKRLDEILSADFRDDLPQLDIRDLRTVRSECQEYEAALSYMRRVVQGRLDIVAAEEARRAEGRPPTDLTDMVSRLPEILSDRVRSPGFGRLPQLWAPADVAAALGDVEEIAPASVLSTIMELGESALVDLTVGLSEYERSVSERRRALHDLLDDLQAELIRRYKSGEATVETLLS